MSAGWSGARSLAAPDPHVDAAARATGALRREGGALGRWVGSLRVPELLLFAGMFAGPLPGLGDHANEICMALLVVLSLFRRPLHSLGSLAWLIPVFAGLLTLIGLISLFQPIDPGASDWRLRLVRMSFVTALLLVTATGRVDLRSGIAAMAGISLLNVPLFYAGIASDTYGGYLTGLFGDKNFAGLMYATVGVLSTAMVRRLPLKILVYLLFAVPLWLTGSRTSLAAYALAAVWMLIGARLHPVGKIALGALSVWLVEITAEDYSRVGVFSDRIGSDLLRSRIDAATAIKVEETGFLGRGLGNAFVHIQGRDWFFHNSYSTALVEGGWPWTVFVVGVTAVILLQPFRSPRLPVLSTSAGLGVVMLVTASRLGEVFYTLPWGIAMAFGIQAYLVARDGPAELEGSRGRGRAPIPGIGR